MSTDATREPRADDAEVDDASDGADDTAGRLIGSGVKRQEDERLLTGRAEFTDDRSHPDTAHLAFVRSDVAHADVINVDSQDATALDGVRAVYTWDDVAASDAPGVIPVADDRLDCDVPGHPILARDRVRYEGQPVAAVVADNAYRAADAVEAVEVTYDEREAVVDPRAALAGDAPQLYNGAPDNIAVTTELGDREATMAAFATADHVIERDLVNNRLVPSALEPRAALARWDGDEDQLVVEMTSQSPHGHRGKLAATLGRPEQAIRVIAPAVGGGFGHKGHHHPGEAMAAWAAIRLGQPVKWTATRSGNYRAGAHGRDHRTSAAIAVDDDGTIRGIRAETDAGVGGYGLGISPLMPGWYGRLLASQYDVDAIHCKTRAAFTTTAPVHSYRGAGRPEAVYVTERLVSAAARELGLDPATVRRRNLIDPDAFPYETPVGATYDSGDYEPALDAALDALDDADYTGAHPENNATGRPVTDAVAGNSTTDDDGRYVGIGLTCYVESTGGGYESGVVRAHPDGTVTAYVGTHSHGQGHATTYAQVIADELPVSYDDVHVVEGDTERTPNGTGTFGSRSTITGGNAVAESAAAVRTKARRIAATELDASTGTVEVTDDGFHDPDSGDSIAFPDVASAAYSTGLPDEMEPGLESTTFYEPDGTAYTFGTHAAVVAIDPKTGDLDVPRYVAVDDCGERINPTIVEGQIHGGVAQGLGQALSERAAYDESGELVTDSMLQYGVPRAGDLPSFETKATVTPSPRNELGVKGIGEAGTIAAPPAVVNAALDALAPLGVDHLDMPLTEETVRAAIETADNAE